MALAPAVGRPVLPARSRRPERVQVLLGSASGLSRIFLAPQRGRNQTPKARATSALPVAIVKSSLPRGE